jgi:hypothetical protein
MATSVPPTAIGHTPLRSAAESLLADIAAQKTPQSLLSHFSTTQTVTIQHNYVHSTTPHLFVGLHAVRSYFDLLALHWTRDDMQIHEYTDDADKRRVVVKANVRWTWRRSKKSWREEFTCTLDFDEWLKVSKFVVESSPPEHNCVMLAVEDGTV